MKKEEILALGVAEDVAQKLMDMVSEELKGYIPKSRFDEVNEAKKNAEALVKERDGQLDGLKKSAGDSEALKKQIEELQNANKETAKKYAEDLKRFMTTNGIEKMIGNANGKNVKAIMALLDLSKAELQEDGTVSTIAEQLEALTKAEDSSFLFASSVPDVKGFNPATGAGGTPDGNVDFSKMSYSQLSEYLASNPDARIS